MALKNVLIPRNKHQKMLTWAESPRPRFKRKIQLWCEETIGQQGQDWHIEQLHNKGGPMDYRLRCSRMSAILFALTWL